MIRHLFLLILCILAMPCMASMLPLPDLPFRTYKSADGRIEYDVDPTNRQGAGICHVVTHVDGAKVWEGELPFTFWEAAVTKDGMLAGYGYSNGCFPALEFDENKNPIPGNVIAACINKDGSAVTKESFPRNSVPFPDTIPQTTVESFEYDAASNRMIVSLNDEDLNRGNDYVWIVRIGSSEKPRMIRPAEIAAPDDKFRSGRKISITGTPLILCANTKLDSEGMKFVRWILVDADGKKYWSLDDKLAAGDPSDGITHSPDTPGSFTLRLTEKNELATFLVENDAGSWRVEQTGSAVAGAPTPTPYPESMVQRLNSGPDPSKFVEKQFPVVEKVTLERAMEKPSPFSTFLSADMFAMDEAENIAIIRKPGGPVPSFVLLTPAGDVKTGIEFPQLSPNKGQVNAKVCYLGANQFLIFANDNPKADEQKIKTKGKGRGAPMHPWIVNAATKDVRTLPIDVWSQNSVDAFHRGMFAVLDGKSDDINDGQHVRVFDLQGDMLWSIDKMPLSKDNIFSPQDICFTSDGNIAVLYHFPKSIITYSQKGEVLVTAILQDVLGVEPKYPADIYAGKNGSLYVGDNNGPKPFVRIGSDGKVTGEFTLAARFFETDLAGNLWFTDGYTMQRMNDDMQVDKLIGKKPSDQEIGDLRKIVISRTGNIYLMEVRTNAIHVFGTDGKKISVIHPSAEDVSSDVAKHSGYEISPLNNGNMILFRWDWGAQITAAEYSRDGTRLRTIALPGSINGARPEVQSATGKIWMGQYKKLQLLDENGKVLKDIERYADRQWIDRIGEMETNQKGDLLIHGRSDQATYDSGNTLALFDHDGNAVSAQVEKQSFGHLFLGSFEGEFYTRNSMGWTYAFDLQNNPLWRFAIPHEEEVEFPLVNIVAVVGDQLWVFDMKQTIWKHDLKEPAAN